MQYSKFSLLAKFRYKKYFVLINLPGPKFISFTSNQVWSIMSHENFSIRHILGLKIHDLRTKNNLSFQELSEKSGLSISYLSEIEKGKKYPKGDKMMALADTLGVSYDSLVSLKVSKKLTPIIDLLQSDIFKEFPLETFGLDPQKIVELVSSSPEKITAFINSITNIARNYEMRGEHFYYAAIRSYQELNDNYFPEIEKEAVKFRKKYKLDEDFIDASSLRGILASAFNTEVDNESLESHKVLRDLRSFSSQKANKLLLNKGLTSAQEAFLLGRELGFNFLGLENRPFETPPQRGYNFECILNNYKASYFSAALILPEKLVVEKVRQMASSEKWDKHTLSGLLKKYNATPEMLMQRLTNILPKHFGLKNLFFLRFVGTDNFSSYHLTKELHLSRAHNPHSNSLNESYCRRWLSIRMIKQLRSSSKINSMHSLNVDAQISQYYGTEDEYLCITMAFPNISNAQESISVTIGFYIDDTSKKRIKFIKDPSIRSRIVNTTCERCAWTECEDRVAPPYIIEKQKKNEDIQNVLNQL